MGDLIDRQAAISAICNACGKIDCDKMDKCEKLQLPPANCSEFPNNSDTISRQAAIDAILAVTGNSSVRELYEHVQEHELSDMWSGGVNAAIDIIIAVPPVQPEPQWIPCSERLPEDDTEVFVYLFDRPSPYIAWVTDSCWFTEEFQVEEEYYPKAWMPLPEPYTERREE